MWGASWAFLPGDDHKQEVTATMARNRHGDQGFRPLRSEGLGYCTRRATWTVAKGAGNIGSVSEDRDENSILGHQDKWQQWGPQLTPSALLV